MKLEFNRTYFFAFILLLITEAAIAILLKSGFIRHTFGDYLVVILLYCFLRTFWNEKPIIVAVVVLIISSIVELLQLTTYLEYFNLHHNYAVKIVLGSTFSFSDLVAYTLGFLTVIILEYLMIPKRKLA